MKATVKVAYFDDAGLHKPREIVEVKAANPYVEIIAEEKPAEIKTEEKSETKKNKPRKKEG